MTEKTRQYISHALREAAKYAATYGLGYGIGALIPIKGMRYAELGHIIGGASVLVRAYINEHRQNKQ